MSDQPLPHAAGAALPPATCSAADRARLFAGLMVSRGVEFGTYERDKNKEITIKPMPYFQQLAGGQIRCKKCNGYWPDRCTCAQPNTKFSDAAKDGGQTP